MNNLRKILKNPISRISNLDTIITLPFGDTRYVEIYKRLGWSISAHNGIDLDSNSSTQVRAVKAGKLYGGSYQCGGSYPGALLFAKVDNGDGTTSWYLHMTPQ